MQIFSKRVLSALKCAVAGLMWAAAAVAVACVEGNLRGDAVSFEREVGATPAGDEASMNVLGAGWFRVASIEKHGGSSDQTYVTLELDGEPVITASFAALKNPWMQLNTSYIVANVQTDGDTSIMTIWYSPELKFRAMAVLRVDVKEEGVDSLRMRTVMNKPAPHEHPPGTTPTTLALPAFK
ncbi:MAG TPA: hypothetical protein VN664_10065 [Burkholderiales bacterium]|jgi:hypothetical protein|nr:hypothetical protein [Burkholderiales bacterium]